MQAIQMFNPEFPGLNISSVNAANDRDAMVQLPAMVHPELEFSTWGTNSENYSQYVRIKEELEDSVNNFQGFQHSSGGLYADHPQISSDYSGAAVTSGNSLWAQQNLPPANFGSQNLHTTSGNYRLSEMGCLGRVDLNYLQHPINMPVSNHEKVGLCWFAACFPLSSLNFTLCGYLHLCEEEFASISTKLFMFIFNP